MELNEEATWPYDLLAFLERHHDLFKAWEEQRCGAAPATVAGEEYDRALYDLRDVLNNHALHGYHCARLTRAEIDHICAKGMQLPDEVMLRRRIEAVRDAGLFDADIAAQFIAKNQAAETNRAGKIWFCFFPPHLGGENGIESLLRYWGGEALYNSHETDKIRGPILAKLGVPCLIEANVPIASLRGPGFLDMKVAQQFLMWRGFNILEPVTHEDCAVYPLAASDIVRIIEFPEREFIRLTCCDTWRSPLA
jgi:hypothetical protein